MINLLPPEMKQDYRYARHNRRLVQWSMAVLLAIVGVALLTAGGMLIMDRSTQPYKADIFEAEARLSSQNMTETQKQVTAITNNLKLMVTVLSKEILFSKLLVQLGNSTPPKVVLTSLSISQTDGAIDITARAANYNSAAQLQANLADPDNKIFSKADIVSIACSANNTDKLAASYPCVITIKALFAPDNPFLFINDGKAARS